MARRHWPVETLQARRGGSRVNGELRVYYGVTYDGMHGPWQTFAGEDE